MVSDAILDCTKRDDIVLDSYIGSGTTLLAAKNLHRPYFGCDANPAAISLTRKRLEFRL